MKAMQNMMVPTAHENGLCGRRAATWSVLVAIASAALLPAHPAAAESVSRVLMPGVRTFPESITSDAAGNIYFGSLANGTIYRARPGDKIATVFAISQKSDIRSGLGVFADDRANTLYACSVIFGDHTPAWDPKYSSLHTFNLKTGAHLASYPMPNGAKSLCNDIAVAPDGSAYVTDTFGGQILRLKKGATALDKWTEDERLKGADGIALGADGSIYVNTFTTFKLLRVAIKQSGDAGAVEELKTSLPLDHPDGLRSIGGMKFLQAEGLGRITLVTVEGARADMQVLTSGNPGLTSMTVVDGKIWALNAKLAYLTQSEFKDKDPGEFAAELIGPLPE